MTAQEHPVVDIWCRVLGTEHADPAANFFDLGGDSVAAARICAQARESGYPLTLDDIFIEQTLGAVLARAEAGGPR